MSEYKRKIPLETLSGKEERELKKVINEYLMLNDDDILIFNLPDNSAAIQIFCLNSLIGSYRLDIEELTVYA